jgi:hypothetical protein
MLGRGRKQLPTGGHSHDPFPARSIKAIAERKRRAKHLNREHTKRMPSVSEYEIDVLFRVDGVIKEGIVGGALDLASAPALPPNKGMKI